jgi:hypothetical protein
MVTIILSCCYCNLDLTGAKNKNLTNFNRGHGIVV